MRSLLILLVSVVVCFGQYMPMADPAFIARANYEVLSITDTNNYNLITNITGYPAYGWWPVTRNVGTNGSLLSLTNLVAGSDTTISDFTNQIAGRFPIYTPNTINGYAAFKFDGVDDYLRALNITAADVDTPMELFVVAAYTNIGVTKYMFGGSANAAYYSVRVGSPANIAARLGGNATDLTPTNKWIVFHASFNTNNLGVGLYTNGACAARATGTAGQANNLLILGSAPDLTSSMNVDIAEVIIYRTNFGLSHTVGSPYPVGAVSNVFYHLTNKYAISLNSGP